MTKLSGAERIVLKLPKELADYFRKTIRHGGRGKFIIDHIKKYRRDDKFKKFIHKELRINI